MRSPLDHRLLVVMGKGGVGRTTATAALGLAAARLGKRTACVEMNGLGSLAAAFGLASRRFAPRPAAPGVDTFSLSTYESLDDFGRRKLKIGALVHVVFRNRITHALIDGIPGMHDLMQLGKLRNLLAEPLADDPHYDLAVLDAPATGHGLTLLHSGTSMADLTRVGPFFEEARQIDAWFTDRDLTGIAVVTLPERLPIQESLELIDGLEANRGQVAAVLVNQTLPAAIAAPDLDGALQSALEGAGRPDLAALVADARGRREREEDAVAALLAGLDARGLGDAAVIRLPSQPAPLDRAGLEALADAILEEVGGA